MKGLGLCMSTYEYSNLSLILHCINKLMRNLINVNDLDAVIFLLMIK